jgi:CDP-4-dehydro-6-deoxyglucose reductase, E1
MIPLMKCAFFNEIDTKLALSEFIKKAEIFSMSTQCTSFEVMFAQKQGRDKAVLFNSGGSANLALLQSLKNLGRIKEGDNIGFSALTWATNVMPIIQMGMVPVAVDCEINTLNVSSKQLQNTIEKIDLKVLFLTNVLGFVDNIWEVKRICDDHSIILIEDNCEALGTIDKYGIKTGNYGVASTFSFYVGHHMSTIEGGMVCSNDNELIEMLKIVRANGWDRNLSPQQQQQWREKYEIQSDFEAKYTFYDLGYNLRPTEITGFLGLLQLENLSKAVMKRETNFLLIESIIKENPDLISIEHNHITQLSPFSIPIICKTPELRKEYLCKFFDAGVETRPMIAGNIQKQPFYKKYVKKVYELPNTDFLHNNSFYCGNYPEMSENDLNIIKTVLTKN